MTYFSWKADLHTINVPRAEAISFQFVNETDNMADHTVV